MVNSTLNWVFNFKILRPIKYNMKWVYLDFGRILQTVGGKESLISLFTLTAVLFLAHAYKCFRTASLHPHSILCLRSNNMVIQCVVYQCTNRQGERARDNGVSFFRFPKDSKKRKAWVRAINRDEWVPTEFSRVCSEHFTGGWHSDDADDENYRPTIFKYKQKPRSDTDIAREERKCRRNLQQVHSYMHM